MSSSTACRDSSAHRGDCPPRLDAAGPWPPYISPWSSFPDSDRRGDPTPPPLTPASADCAPCGPPPDKHVVSYLFIALLKTYLPFLLRTWRFEGCSALFAFGIHVYKVVQYRTPAHNTRLLLTFVPPDCHKQFKQGPSVIRPHVIVLVRPGLGLVVATAPISRCALHKKATWWCGSLSGPIPTPVVSRNQYACAPYVVSARCAPIAVSALPSNNGLTLTSSSSSSSLHPQFLT